MWETRAPSYRFIHIYRPTRSFRTSRKALVKFFTFGENCRMKIRREGPKWLKEFDVLTKFDGAGSLRTCTCRPIRSTDTVLLSLIPAAWRCYSWLMSNLTRRKITETPHGSGVFITDWKDVFSRQVWLTWRSVATFRTLCCILSVLRWFGKQAFPISVSSIVTTDRRPNTHRFCSRGMGQTYRRTDRRTNRLMPPIPSVAWDIIKHRPATSTVGERCWLGDEKANPPRQLARQRQWKVTRASHNLQEPSGQSWWCEVDRRHYARVSVVWRPRHSTTCTDLLLIVQLFSPFTAPCVCVTVTLPTDFLLLAKYLQRALPQVSDDIISDGHNDVITTSTVQHNTPWLCIQQ